jgi:hypothetical protein
MVATLPFRPTALIGNRRFLSAIVLATLGASAATAQPTSSNENGKPSGRRAAAWYRIELTPLPLVEKQTTSDFEFDQYRRTQKALIGSPLVLSAALAQQGVASSAALRDVEDKLVWLDRRLSVTFPDGGSAMEIAVADKEASKEDLLALANAVSKAYYDEVVFREQAERSLPLQILQNTSRRLTELLHGKLDDMKLLEGNLGLDSASVAKQRMATNEARLLRQRIEELQSRRFDEELKQLLAEAGAPGDVTSNAAELKKAINELFQKEEDRLKTRLDQALTASAAPAPSADLELRRQEIESLKETLRAINGRVQSLQIDIQKPSRVHAFSAKSNDWAAATFYSH